MKPSSLAHKRDMMWRKALRKRRITQHYPGSDTIPYYDNLHQYSKNKIHCSCPLCAEKTRNKGHRRYHKGNYNRALNYKASELRRQISMDEQENNYDSMS